MQRSIAALAMLLIAALGASAKNGRDFGGFYSVTNAARDGRQVRVTVMLQIFNYSGEDLAEASVMILHSPPVAAVFGTYSPIEQWRDGTDVRLAMHITVPEDEYDHWAGRRQPSVCVVTRDSQGRELQRTVQLSRRPAIQLQEDSDAQ
ncbi:MAG TPA: hypothetical protein VMT86_17070 [Bryobacteraceae bacterium]|nr:hypothetical protein [Bryobacteraceae bacterium]